MASSLAPAFLSALQGSVSVLLTLLAGYVVARHHVLDRSTVKHMSKLCSSIFLPCLIIVQMGPELTVSLLREVWIIPAWGLLSTIVAHLIGWMGKTVLGLPYWTIVASGRPNSTALPLLLLQSLANSGVLDVLAGPDEPVSKILGRAKSFILLNVIVQQTFTFQLAPMILAKDGGHRKDDPEDGNRLHPSSGRLNPTVQDREHVGLLWDRDIEHISYGTPGEDEYYTALRPIQDTPDIRWPRSMLFLEKRLKPFASHLSPPLLAAIVALVLGITPPLHKAFLDEDGVLYTSITESVKNLGELFVALQMFSVGAELALVPSIRPNALACTFSLFMRFMIMPALSLLFVWISAGRGLYSDDPLVWFLLVLIPSGPSAMLLMSVAEIVDIDQAAIAGYLTMSYLISPLIAVVCALGLKVVDIVQEQL